MSSSSPPSADESFELQAWIARTVGPANDAGDEAPTFDDEQGEHSWLVDCVAIETRIRMRLGDCWD